MNEIKIGSYIKIVNGDTLICRPLLKNSIGLVKHISQLNFYADDYDIIEIEFPKHSPHSISLYRYKLSVCNPPDKNLKCRKNNVNESCGGK